MNNIQCIVSGIIELLWTVDYCKSLTYGNIPNDREVFDLFIPVYLLDSIIIILKTDFGKHFYETRFDL